MKYSQMVGEYEIVKRSLDRLQKPYIKLFNLTKVEKLLPLYINGKKVDGRSEEKRYQEVSTDKRQGTTVLQ